MKLHRNAKTTPAMRALLVERIRHQHWPAAEAAAAAGISVRTTSGFDRSALRIPGPLGLGYMEMVRRLKIATPGARDDITGVNSCLVALCRAIGATSRLHFGVFVP